MTTENSVTQWVRQLEAGDADAARRLWERYFQRLVGLARKKLQGRPRRAADEEDVALSAFDSFCQGAEAGQFHHLLDRASLWPLLVIITVRKATNLIQHENRQKRGGNALVEEGALPGPDSSQGPWGLDGLLGQEPTPEFAAQVAEEYERLLTLLGDAHLQDVARWKMEGYSNDEIAGKLDCVPRTVERKLRTIRSIWEQQTVSS
jgi:DNA-directed RNA polymerase specialized sigma24 family protein